MISLKRYLEQTDVAPAAVGTTGDAAAGSELAAAYRSLLDDVGQASVQVCPHIGNELENALRVAADGVDPGGAAEKVRATQSAVHGAIEHWTRDTTAHYRTKAQEVKDILLAMSRVAQSVGERDEQAAAQMSAVTQRLEKIASLDDVTEIRASIAESASELKASVDRMAAAGRQAMDALRAEVQVYRTRMEEAESSVARDALTGLGSRLWTEDQIRRRIKAGASFCVAVLDIDSFKQINDRHGHVSGDELLRQFAKELRGACRSTDVVGRWGGDEFVVVLDCHLDEGIVRIERIQKWVCGNYTLPGRGAEIPVQIGASIGVAEWSAGESLELLLDRADAAMYQQKSEGLKHPPK